MRNTRHQSPAAALVVTCLLALAFCALAWSTPESMRDDVLYEFFWRAGENEGFAHLQSVADVVESQQTFYHVQNGRTVVQTLAQLFIGLTDKHVSDVLSTLMFGWLLWLMACGVRREPPSAARVLLVAAVVFLCLPAFGEAFLWWNGQFNYLWTAVFIMLVLLGWRRAGADRVTPFMVFALPLAFFAGWSHEGFALPLSLALVVDMVRRRFRLHPAAWLLMVFFLAGTAFCVLAPATFARAGVGGVTPAQWAVRLGLGVLTLLRYAHVCVLLLVVLAVLLLFNRRLLAVTCHSDALLLTAALSAMLLGVVSGQTEARVFFAADFYAALLLLRWVCQLRPARWLRLAGSLVAAACLLAVYVPTLLAARVNVGVAQAMVQQIACGRKVVGVDNRRPAIWWQRWIVSRYVIRPVDFGYFINYQAYDKTDENVRAMQAKYGRKDLMFVPQTLLSAWERGDQPEHFSLDGDEPLLCRRLEPGLQVRRVEVKLAAEDPQRLPVHKRLFAYNGDVCEVEPHHFGVVEWGTSRFLLVERPVGNVARRMKEIVVSVQ